MSGRLCGRPVRKTGPAGDGSPASPSQLCRIRGTAQGPSGRYKASWRGGRVVVADRWYPSYKTCSDCGAVKAKLRLSERAYMCGQCGHVLDRDLNAALNLAALVFSRSWRATFNEPDGNPGKTSAVLAAVPPREGPRGQRRAARQRLMTRFCAFS